LCEAIIDDVRNYQSPEARSDDLTLVVVRAL